MDSMSGSAARFPKQAWVVGERLQFEHGDFLVIGMRGINQAIDLSGSKNRRHEQEAMLSSLLEFIPEAGSFMSGCDRAPITTPIDLPKLRPAPVIPNFSDVQSPSRPPVGPIPSH